jgi:hypothetical protein
MSSEFSVLSDFSWAKVNKGSLINNDFDKRFDDPKEKWESEYPTRTDISDIDTVKEIVPIFGDSFMFCASMPKRYDISHLLRTGATETLFINLARGGLGNNRIITRLEQWTNDKNSEKTKTIIISFSSMYRYDYYLDIEKPNTIKSRTSIYDTNDVRGYDIMAQLHPDFLLDSEDKSIRDTIRKPLTDVWADIVQKQTSYTQTMLKHLETNIRRLDWITRSKNWNVIYIQNDSWGDNLHYNDKKVINKYLEEMDTPERRFKIIKMFNGDGSIVDRLECGHYGYSTLNILKKKIIKEYNEL